MPRNCARNALIPLGLVLAAAVTPLRGAGSTDPAGFAHARHGELDVTRVGLALPHRQSAFLVSPPGSPP